MSSVRRIMSVAEVRILPMNGDEDGLRWRGVLFDTDEFCYYTGNEYADLAFEDWDLSDTPPPDHIRVCLDYLCSVLALQETTEGLEL